MFIGFVQFASDSQGGCLDREQYVARCSSLAEDLLYSAKLPRLYIREQVMVHRATVQRTVVQKRMLSRKAVNSAYSGGDLRRHLLVWKRWTDEFCRSASACTAPSLLLT